MSSLAARCKLYWPYVLLALLIMLPLLKPGYVLTVDMVFVPHMPAPAPWTSSYLFFGLLHVLSLVMPSMIIQKLLLLGIFIVSGIGMHRLMQLFRPANVAAKEWRWAAYFGGLLYACNPFVYTRLLAGQYALLAGYALLPFLVVAVWRWCQAPGKRTTATLTTTTILLSVVSLHMFGIGLLLVFLVASGYGWQHRHDKTWWRAHGRWGGAAMLIILLASSYWLVPLITGHGQTAETIARFGGGDLQAFRTVPGHLGLAGNVLALQGFWGDARNLYLLPQDGASWWLAPIICLWLLVAVGMAWSWRHQRRLGLFFGACVALGLILAIGTAGTLVEPFNRLLVDHLPFFGGYREPQKFAVLIVLGYAYFGGLGLVWLRRTLQGKRELALVLLLLPLACTPYLPWGAAGQLAPTHYPDNWYAFNAQLQQEATTHGQVLFLPWHLYLPFSFTSSVIANPAPKFFDAPVISGNNPEIGSATGYATNQTTVTVGHLLPQAAHDPQFAAQLARLNIHYVVVAKTLDYRKYDYLQHTPGIQLLSNTPTLTAYRVMPQED